MEEITPALDDMQNEDLENHRLWLEKRNSGQIVGVEKNIAENNIEENLNKPKRLVLRVVNNHNKEISNTTDNLIVLDDSNNETQEFGGDSTSSTSGEGERSDAYDSGSEKSKESEENEKDEEMTRNEIEVFIDQMKSDLRYKLVEYRAWRLYEPTQRDVKLFDKMNLYDFAVNQEANILISALGQIVQIKRRKKGFNWAILSLGYIEISGRNRLSAILRKEETTDVIAVPICDLIPDSRKIQISAQQREELLAQYQSSLTQPKAKSSPRVRKRTQTNYFTPNSPNKRLKSLINSPQLSTPKSTPKTLPKIIPKTSPKLRDAVVTDDSSQCELGMSFHCLPSSILQYTPFSLLTIIKLLLS